MDAALERAARTPYARRRRVRARAASLTGTVLATPLEHRNG